MESYAPFLKQHAMVVKGLHQVGFKPCLWGAGVLFSSLYFFFDFWALLFRLQQLEYAEEGLAPLAAYRDRLFELAPVARTMPDPEEVVAGWTALRGRLAKKAKATKGKR